MEIFNDKIKDAEQRSRLEEIFTWIKQEFPTLEPVVKWNQPMFTDHGTFIIGFSVAKNHISVAPESIAIKHFEEDIKNANYDHTKELFRIQWKDPVDYTLLEKLIDFNITDKADYQTFWR